MFKSLAALIAATALSVPAIAKIDPGTPQLLQTLTEYGVSIAYNPSICGTGFQGRYNTNKEMVLCYTGVPGAGDHDTVRHEAFHFLQHCASINRGEGGIQPLATNTATRNNWIRQVLQSGHIQHIKSTYPENHHQVELEAFAAAHHYSASELIGLIRSWCTK
jgi:hypothetical protein